MKASTDEILQHIYDSEIHLSLGWMWDGGIHFSLGLEDTSRYTGHNRIDDAVIEIARVVAEEYPESEFHRWWTA